MPKETPNPAAVSRLSTLNLADQDAVRAVVEQLESELKGAIDLGVEAHEAEAARADALAKDLAAAQSTITTLETQVRDLAADGGASAKELEAANATVETLRQQLAAAVAEAPAPTAPHVDTRGRDLGKPPKGEVWLTSRVTVTSTVDGKEQDVPPGTPFTLRQADAIDHIGRFGGELL